MKRVEMEEKLLWMAYRNSPTLFRTVPSPTLYGVPFLEIGVCNLTTPLLSQEQVKLRTSNLAVYRANPNKSPLTILEKRERGYIQGLSKFLDTAY